MMNKLHKIFLLGMILLSVSAYSQDINLKRLDPSSWWVGMKNKSLMLLAYGNNISQCNVSANIKGVKITGTKKLESNNYLFVFLEIDNTAVPGNYFIDFTKNGKTLVHKDFQLLKRNDGSASRPGFNSSDAIYLIMPDRFANGDTTNDNIKGMNEMADRKAPYGRHGGDIKGIAEHLDYIYNLGATSIWLTPVLENNQVQSSYHGYSITDYYNVDPRLGTNNDYKELADLCHKKGMKIIMDMVFNHCGSKHWWMEDLPSKDWIHQFPTYTSSNYRLSTVADIHASIYDKERNVTGWFDRTMPDLNLDNEYMKTYMIQNSIWWVEYAGLDGIRMDTYPYPEKEGMADWMKALLNEYPSFNVVGEVWISSASKTQYWQKDAMNRDGYNSYLPSLMDFPMMEAIQKAFNENDTWSEGLARLYDVLADDFLYTNPNNLVVFAENHDNARIFEYYNKDIRKFKMAMTYVATVRGIPQIYYGSEILKTGNGFRGHSEIRTDFPGGWPKDSANSFLSSGRTELQNEAVNHMTKLYQYRRNHAVLQNGKLVHFIPENNVYVYFRILNDEAVMVVFNNHDTEKRAFDTQRFNEILSKYKSGVNIVTGEGYSSLHSLTIEAKSTLVIELKK